jgi:hypothetical protein
MKLTSDNSKFTNRWKFVEVAKYVKSLKKVIREKNGDLPAFVHIDEVPQYAMQNANVRNIHFYMALR